MKRAGQLADRIMTNTYIKEATYVVPEDELGRYRTQLGFMKGDYEVVGCSAVGIAATRLWIGQLARKRREKSFCMMDDDLKFARRNRPTGLELIPCDKQDIQEMLTWMDERLQSYVHVSISTRDKNHTIGVRELSSELWAENGRTLRILAYQTDKFLAMKHGRVEVMEDFDVNLQLLRAGHSNITSFYWSNDQRETGTKGGCSEYRTLEVHEASARRLIELHAPFVTPRVKTTKARGKDAGKLATRLEVTIQWKKAFASSQGQD